MQFQRLCLILALVSFIFLTNYRESLYLFGSTQKQKEQLLQNNQLLQNDQLFRTKLMEMDINETNFNETKLRDCFADNKLTRNDINYLQEILPNLLIVSAGSCARKPNYETDRCDIPIIQYIVCENYSMIENISYDRPNVIYNGFGKVFNHII